MKCRKVKYGNYYYAFRAKDKFGEKLKKQNKPNYLRAYYCEKCKCWHLTSMTFEQYESTLKKNDDSKRPKKFGK